MRLLINSARLTLSTDNTITIYIHNDITIKKIALISAIIPFSFYNIREATGNTFKLNDIIYTLPSKQYNAYQLKDAINALIISTPVNVSFDKSTLHFVFSSNSSFTFDPLNLGVILGFVKVPNTPYSSSLINGVHHLESIYACDMTNQVRNINIRSNLTLKNYENGVFGGSILYRIPINTTFGNMIVYQNPSDTLLNVDIDTKISALELTLIDSNYVPLDLNHLSYTLEFFLETTDDDMFTKHNNIYNSPLLSTPNISTHPYELLRT